MEISARYYDGRTSQSSEVRLVFYHEGSVQLFGEGVSHRFRYADLKVESRVGNTPRTITLPNQGKCEVKDNAALERILASYGDGGQLQGTWIHRLESSLGYVALAVILTAGFAWGMVGHGIPWMAEQAAYALPQGVDRKLGQGTLRVLDRSLFKPSALSEQYQARLKQRFAHMTQGLDARQNYRLEFRLGEKIGANAFALPSGIVVVTDELVELSEDDEQLVAVLAHEIGHLEYRHSLRMVMQGSALALVISAVTGDPFSTSTLAVALPTVLVHAGYSRDFETEADIYAYDYLVANGIPTEKFAEILLRLGGDEETSEVEEFLASHPGTRERIERFKQGASGH